MARRMEMEIVFTLENPGEAEAFCEVIKTYPHVVAQQCETDGSQVTITVPEHSNIEKVLRDLVVCFRPLQI